MSFEKLIAFVIALALLGAGILIFVGESSGDEWATFDTRNAPPSVEVIP